MNLFHKYRDTLAAFAVALGLVILAGNLGWKASSEKPSLSPPAQHQDIYVIGNSMFGTGLDLKALRQAFPKSKVDFAYYNGYYTSLWDLAVNVGMTRANAPKLIVWGFRPTYAIYPSFRQNRNTKENQLARNMPSAHRNVLINAGDPSYGKVEKSALKSDTSTVAQNQQNEPFELIGTSLTHQIESPFRALNDEKDVLGAVRGSLATFFIKLIRPLGAPDSLFENGKLAKASDLLIRYVTHGKIQTADALVVDNGEKFIKGRQVPFAASFVPMITQQIKRLGAQQVVVIFKPVSTFNRPLSKPVQKYYEDALAYFKANHIEVIDLLKDDALTRDMYVRGDHVNAKGEAEITKRIIDNIKTMKR